MSTTLRLCQSSSCARRRAVCEVSMVKIIIIDYLQLMNATGMKFGSREQEVSVISRSLKQLAKELNIPVIALSQLSRKVEERNDGNRRPQLSDLRESGAIEQDADIVCFIHRPEYYTRSTTDAENRDIRGMAEFIVAKHRSGSVDDIEMTFVAWFAGSRTVRSQCRLRRVRWRRKSVTTRDRRRSTFLRLPTDSRVLSTRRLWGLAMMRRADRCLIS